MGWLLLAGGGLLAYKYLIAAPSSGSVPYVPPVVLPPKQGGSIYSVRITKGNAPQGMKLVTPGSTEVGLPVEQHVIDQVVDTETGGASGHGSAMAELSAFSANFSPRDSTLPNHALIDDTVYTPPLQLPPTKTDTASFGFPMIVALGLGGWWFFKGRK